MFNQLHNQIEQRFMSKLQYHLHFCSYFSFCFSQNKLSGVLTAGSENAIYNSVVALLTPVDSVLYQFTRSDKDGKFLLKT
jgi:hypothetical protein